MQSLVRRRTGVGLSASVPVNREHQDCQNNQDDQHQQGKTTARATVHAAFDHGALLDAFRARPNSFDIEASFYAAVKH